MTHKSNIKKVFGWIILILLSSLLLFNPVRAEEEKLPEVPEISESDDVTVTGTKPKGSGTVIDYAQSGDREFFTIMTEDDSVYYLVIDKDKDVENVYYLKEINNTDLEKGQSNNIKPKPTPDSTKPQDSSTGEDGLQNNEYEDPDVEKEQPYTLYIVAGTVVVVGIVGYYTIILKPKKEKQRLQKKAEGDTNSTDNFDDFMDELYETDEYDEGY